MIHNKKFACVIILVLAFFAFSASICDCADNKEPLSGWSATIPKTYSGKIKTVSGKAIEFFVPIARVKMRAHKNINSRQVGLITPDNDFKYRIFDAGSGWVKVCKGNTIKGYCVKKFFNKRWMLLAESEINLNGNAVQFKTIIAVVCNQKLFCAYTYKVNSKGNTLYKSSTLICYIDKYVKTYSQDLKASNKYSKSYLNELIIDKKVVGWLFGWNKFKGEDYQKELDFSVARLIVPYLDNGQIKLYEKRLNGVELTDIYSCLPSAKREIKIIYMEAHCGVFSGGCSIGYYYIPHEISLTKKGDGKLLIKEKRYVEITEKLIAHNPYYAYSLAYIFNNKEIMKKAYEKFKKELVEVDKKCGQYVLDLDRFVVNDRLQLEKYWHSFVKPKDKYEGPIEYKAAKCLEKVIGPERSWYLFYRTGLFPSRKIIEQYLDNEYVAEPRE